MKVLYLEQYSLCPDRLSYSEMAIEETLYPSEWTESFDAYIEHKDELVTRMKAVLESNNYEISQ